MNSIEHRFRFPGIGSTLSLGRTRFIQLSGKRGPPQYLLSDYAGLPLNGGTVVALRSIDALKEAVRVAVPAPVSGAVPVFGGGMGAFVSESVRRLFVVDTMMPGVIADTALPARPAGVSTSRSGLAEHVEGRR